MKMFFVALLVSAASFTAAFSVTGVDVGFRLLDPLYSSFLLQITHFQLKNDDIELLKDRILGKISYSQLFVHYKTAFKSLLN